MSLTVGQALLLVRGAIETEPQNLVRNHSLQLLGRLERVVNGNPSISTKGIVIPLVEPRPDFGKSSPQQSEPEEEAEDAPKDTPPAEKPKKRSYTKKTEV